MRIHILSGGQGGKEVGDWEARILRELAARAGPSEHQLVDFPDQADVILITDIFFDHRFWRVLANPVVRRNLDRCYVYCEKALVSRILPGLFTSMPSGGLDPRSRRDQQRVRTAWYTSHERTHANPFLEQARAETEPDLLYSYVGRTSHPLRKRLLRELPRRPDAIVEASDDYDHWDRQTPDREARQLRYAETLARSCFVLCPRGWSPSSIRVFETMQVGRVPVIISDGWRPPLGPSWNDFAMFVRENEVESIPKRLTALLPEADAMGRRARKAWEDFFAPETEWRTLSNALADLHDSHRVNEWRYAPLWPISILKMSLSYAGYRIGGALKRALGY